MLKKTVIIIIALTMILISTISYAIPAGSQSPTSTPAPSPTGPPVSPSPVTQTPASPAPVVITPTVPVAVTGCAECHNASSELRAKQVQYEASQHALSPTFERNARDCAGCHTSQGFDARLAAGTRTAPEEIPNPAPINCRTCHQIHETYTAADYSLTTEEPVTLFVTGDTFDKGKGNLCANCHQPRGSVPSAATASPTGTPTAGPSPTVTVGPGQFQITSVRYGPHYGTQAAVLRGVGGYGVQPAPGIHYQVVSNACVDCHMTDAFGARSGGHSMWLEYRAEEEDVPNLTGCVTCHQGIESFDVNGVQTETIALQTQLRTLLISKGLLSEEDLAVPGVYPVEQVGALWNYLIVKNEGSSGVHNSDYIKALLQYGIDTLQ